MLRYDDLCQSPAFSSDRCADHLAKETAPSLPDMIGTAQTPRPRTPVRFAQDCRPAISAQNACTPREQPRSAVSVTTPHQEKSNDVNHETSLLLVSLGNYLEHVGRSLATYASVDMDVRSGVKVLQPGTLVALRSTLASLVPGDHLHTDDPLSEKANVIGAKVPTFTLAGCTEWHALSSPDDKQHTSLKVPHSESTTDPSSSSSEADSQIPESGGQGFSSTQGEYTSERSQKVVKANSEKIVRLTLARTLSHSITRKFSHRTDLHERVITFLEDPSSSVAAWWYAFLAPFVVLASVLFSLLQTCTPPPIDAVVCAAFELVFDGIFLLEFLIRFLSTPSFCHSFRNPYNVIDSIGLLSLALRIAAGVVLSEEVRAKPIGFVLLCVIPVFRLLKTLRRFQTFQLLLSAFSLAFEALPALLFVLLNISLVFASLIYAVEPRDNIQTWPEALWLTIITMTTVGYGDKYPTSDQGRYAVSVLVIVAQLYSAIPLGIIGNAFTTTWQQRHRVLAILRTRALLVQSGFEARDIPKLFKHMDVDQDGRLSLTDFSAMLQKIKIGLSEDRIIELFHTFDMDGDGTIDEKEFVQGIFPRDYEKVYRREVEEHKEQQKRQRMLAEEGGWQRRISISSTAEVSDLDAAEAAKAIAA